MVWHPMLAAVEVEPAVWVMRAPDGVEYGRIELRRVTGGMLRYKATHAGAVIGWATTLRTACEHVHGAYIAAHGPGGGPIADWGELTGNQRRNAPDATSR